MSSSLYAGDLKVSQPFSVAKLGFLFAIIRDIRFKRRRVFVCLCTEDLKANIWQRCSLCRGETTRRKKEQKKRQREEVWVDDWEKKSPMHKNRRVISSYTCLRFKLIVATCISDWAPRPPPFQICASLCSHGLSTVHCPSLEIFEYVKSQEHWTVYLDHAEYYCKMCPSYSSHLI